MRRFKVSHPGFARTNLIILLAVLCFTSVGIFLLLSNPLEAESKGPRPNDRQVSLIVNALMRRDHLSKHDLDDEMSRRTMKNYLKRLDPLKLYFNESDIAEFMKNRDKLDDMIKKGDIAYGHVIFNRLLERIDQRVKTIDELLDDKHDFTKDENFVTDPDTARYAKNDKEARERWRRRIKFDLLVLKAAKDDDKKTGKEAVEKLKRRYHSFVKRMHQTDDDDILEMYLTSMTNAFDPHTTYMSPSTLENFQIMMKLNLDGIGASLQSEDGYTIVRKIIPGGAADKQGELKNEDHIVSVGQGEDGEMVDVVDMKLDDVVHLVRGKRGTIVRLGVIPGGTGKMKVVKITRAKIELKDSEARGIIFEKGTKADGSKYKIGIIDLPSFYMDMERARLNFDDFKSTTRDVKRILEDFNKKGVDAVVLDLRQNGGGSLKEAINLTGLFIETGPVVQVKDADGRIEHYDDYDSKMIYKGPLVVLTSKFSASASEILAGAIQDYNRGLIVGDNATHGKGTVQSLLDLGQQVLRIPGVSRNLGALKITMQQFYRPDGDSTQKRGVVADISLPAISNNMDVGESDLDYAVEFDKVKAVSHIDYNMVNAKIVDRLAKDANERMKKSEDFVELLDKIAKYLDRKDRVSITINEEKFLKERAELDEDEEEKEEILKEDDPDVIVERDFYFEEVLDITVDYINLLGGRKIAAVTK